MIGPHNYAHTNLIIKHTYIHTYIHHSPPYVTNSTVIHTYIHTYMIVRKFDCKTYMHTNIVPYTYIPKLDSEAYIYTHKIVLHTYANLIVRHIHTQT